MFRIIFPKFGYKVGYMKRLRVDRVDRPEGVLRLPDAGAGDGTRTRTGLPPTVFKTVASAISPLRRALLRYDSMLGVRKQPAVFRLLNCGEPIVWKEYIPLCALRS